MKTNLFFSMALLVVANSSCAAKESKMSAGAESAANRLRKNIASELKAIPNHPWAGEYYAGDGLGVNMALCVAPRSGFVFEWHGCLGLYDRNYGAATWTNDRVHLSFTFENKQQGFQGIAPDLIPVPWGKRRYLVPAGDMVGFCNRVNDGSEPRDGMHGSELLRRGDEKNPISGLPKVPKEFQHYLISKPIVAEIISVGAYKTRPSVADWKFKDTAVVLNAGSSQGLSTGMELLVTEPVTMVEAVRITKVEENQSEGIITQVGEDEPGPKVGWRFSTQAPWKASKRKLK